MQRQKKMTAYGLFIFILGASFYFYDFVLQVSPGIMALSLMNDFKISAGLLGITSGIYFYSYTLMQIPAGLLLARFGAKKILPIVVLTCALGAFIFSIANHPSLLGIGRLLMGGSSAFAFLGALYLITCWLPVRYFAIFAGFTQMIGSLGAIGGETPLAYMIAKIGWRETMLVFAIFGVVLAALIQFLMKKNDETKLHAEHKQFNLWTNFKSVLTSKQTWMIGIYSFATWAPIACFAGLWGVPFLRTTYHLSNIAAANKITILWLAIALACPFIGWFSQKIKKRVLLLIIVSITGVFSSIGLIYCTHQSDLFLSLELIGIGIAASGQSLAFVVINDYQPPHLTGVANGFNNMMIVIGGAIFQPLVGWMLDQHHAIIATQHIYSVENFQFALIVLPALYLLAVFMSSFFIKEPKIQAQQ